ncbi:hypothetical protein Bca52824_096460 [Brassica carinata]|uniref:Uncharacterized protein n=1 Tax=Brassica carinata TaxID=52824 RepID=A0A8X7NY43_BRACI|nr:hypothetical protein Bca52824_096460 [Brassica carinata]
MPALACVDSYAADVFIPPSPQPSAAVDTWSLSPPSLPHRRMGSFSANSSGNISVRPHGNNTLPHQDIDLLKLVTKVTDPKQTGGLGLQLRLSSGSPTCLKPPRVSPVRVRFRGTEPRVRVSLPRSVPGEMQPRPVRRGGHCDSDLNSGSV